MPTFKAHTALQLMVQHNVTAFSAVPAMVLDLVEQADTFLGAAVQAQQGLMPGESHSGAAEGHTAGVGKAAHTDGLPARLMQPKGGELRPHMYLTSVRRIHLGAAELAAALEWRLRLLCPNAMLVLSYGMTEACSSITFRNLDEGVQRSASFGGTFVGHPPPGVQVAIRRLGRTLPHARPSRSIADLPDLNLSGPNPGENIGMFGGSQTEQNGLSRAEGSGFCRPLMAGEVQTRGPHVML